MDEGAVGADLMIEDAVYCHFLALMNEHTAKYHQHLHEIYLCISELRHGMDDTLKTYPTQDETKHKLYQLKQLLKLPCRQCRKHNKETDQKDQQHAHHQQELTHPRMLALRSRWGARYEFYQCGITAAHQYYSDTDTRDKVISKLEWRMHTSLWWSVKTVTNVFTAENEIVFGFLVQELETSIQSKCQHWSQIKTMKHNHVEPFKKLCEPEAEKLKVHYDAKPRNHAHSHEHAIPHNHKHNHEHTTKPAATAAAASASAYSTKAKMLVQDLEFFPEDYSFRNPHCFTRRATELHAEMQRMHDKDTHDDDLIVEELALNLHTEQEQKAATRATSQLLSRSPTAFAQEDSALNTTGQMPLDTIELMNTESEDTVPAKPSALEHVC